MLVALDECSIVRHAQAAVLAAIEDDDGVAGSLDGRYIMISQGSSVRWLLTEFPIALTQF